MSKITIIIGSIITAVLIYAIPILTTCAFILGWDDFTAFLLMGVALTELTCLFVLIYAKAEEGE